MQKDTGSPVKERLVKYFNAALKGLRDENVEKEEFVENTDLSNAICWSIEAMFLHGLKNSKPNKDFWVVVKKVAHKSTLEQIRSFNQIKSDVGRCRAWLRLSINECCLEGYISAILGESSLLTRYYYPSAFLLDGQVTETVLKSVQALADYHFKLSCNSTVLNQWNQPPLQLAGIVSSENLKWPCTNKSGSIPTINLSASSHSGSSTTSPPQPRMTSTPHSKETKIMAKLHTGFPQGLSVSQSMVNLNTIPIINEPKWASSCGSDDESFSKSTGGLLDRDDISEGSTGSRPDFRDARQEFYRTVYDISESEEDDSGKISGKCGGESIGSNNSGGVVDVKKAEDKKLEDEMKFKRIVQNNLEKFPLNYDRKLSALVHENDVLNIKLNQSDASQFVKESTQNTLKVSSNKGCLHSLVSSSSFNVSESNKQNTNKLYNADVNTVIMENTTKSEKLQTDDHGPVILKITPDSDEEKSDSGINNSQSFSSSAKPSNSAEIDDTDVEKNFVVVDQESTIEGIITIDKIIESVVGKKDQETEEIDYRTKKHGSKRNAIHMDLHKDIDIQEQYTSIKYEKGLSAQSFQCKGCSAPIGMFFGKERACAFDRGYYCPECLDKSETIIPNKVIYNWDFRPYKVSKRNYEYLMLYKAAPLINMERLNPSLYDHVPALNTVKIARLRLKFLKSYLLSCNLSLVVDMHAFLDNLSYYSENIHIYSLEDLVKVPSGQLLRSLNRACSFGTSHVHACPLCTVKGFYCEICKQNKIIYPFDLENTTRCESCRAVYHRACKRASRGCPKCQRQAMRNSIFQQSADFDPFSTSPEETRHSFEPQDSINFSFPSLSTSVG